MWQYCVGTEMLHKQVDVERIAELLARYCLAWHDTCRTKTTGAAMTSGRTQKTGGRTAGATQEQDWTKAGLGAVPVALWRGYGWT